MRNMSNRRKMSQPMLFILLFGIVSLFSDMTHEGASSIRGAYLSLLGASAGTIGFVSGLGELIGYSMRYVFGKLTDKTKQYWPMVILGYTLDIIAVPALALVHEDGWIAACPRYTKSCWQAVSRRKPGKGAKHETDGFGGKYLHPPGIGGGTWAEPVSGDPGPPGPV